MRGRLRQNSGPPSSRSSDLMALVTDGCATLHRWAARRKLRFSDTARKYLICCMFMTYLPSSDSRIFVACEAVSPVRRWGCRDLRSVHGARRRAGPGDPSATFLIIANRQRTGRMSSIAAVLVGHPARPAATETMPVFPSRPLAMPAGTEGDGGGASQVMHHRYCRRNNPHDYGHECQRQYRVGEVKS